MDQAGADGLVRELPQQVGQGMPKTAEDHQLIVGQGLLVVDDLEEGVELGIGTGQAAGAVDDGLHLSLELTESLAHSVRALLVADFGQL
jgi:hypothetical protein